MTQRGDLGGAPADAAWLRLCSTEERDAEEKRNLEREGEKNKKGNLGGAFLAQIKKSPDAVAGAGLRTQEGRLVNRKICIIYIGILPKAYSAFENYQILILIILNMSFGKMPV